MQSVCVGDVVEVREQGARRPHVAVCAAIWVTPHGRATFRAHWFYRPEDTPRGKRKGKQRGDAKEVRSRVHVAGEGVMRSCHT